MFDGVPVVVPAGYKNIGTAEEPKIIGAGRDGDPEIYICELHAAEAYKRQHPLMGSEDPNSTDMNDTEFLLGVAAWGDDIDPLEQSDAIERIDRSLLPEDRQNISVRQISGARRIVDKDNKKKKKAALVTRNKRRAAYVIQEMKNPMGIKANYND